ncbi:putative aminotransferase [Sphingomonas changbaiensis NBRC 104936]|uniref:aspartate transaminase n=1 Tax=Sphingomonas changbaiensis NBRC 104936 TaxID=1219043 RepID=A0A0E9MKC4_9SPHN|nr:aminotransferase [Sphingomonas changbaiensis]GAO37953.1 putative aminotransferase [Sphingomonas changbaiensis NBRC 104936]
MNPLYAQMPTTIFEHMSARARETGAINLGQGFPDSNGPADVVDAAARALTERSNQYPPMAGIPELREAVAAHYQRHQQLDLSPAEVIVTSGATEAIAAAILALVTPGDEVVLFQPLYDAYLPLVRRAGGVPKFVRLAPPDWRVTAEALDAAFSERTRVAILNTPLNPAATIIGRDELALIAERVIASNAVLISDEVWEHLVFDGLKHVSPMTLPGMRERTVKIGSAGKIFSLTGWKVGWMCAAPNLAAPPSRAHQFLTFTTPPNLQAAAAYGLAKDDSYFEGMRAAFARSRDRLTAGLREAGWAVLPSQGTYFLSVDLAASGLALDDVTFCDRLVAEFGVAAIPVSAFYAEDPVTHIVRLCFAKRDETLDAAVERMEAALKALR